MIHLSDYRPPDYLIERVEIDIQLHPTVTRVRVTSHMLPNPDRAPGVVPLHCDGDELELQALFVDGARLGAAAYSVSKDKLILTTPPQRPFALSVETIINPAANSKLMGLYRSNGVYCTQCEADGFRRISYFPDRPDVMAIYRVRIEAETTDAPILLSNGNCIEHGAITGSNRHYAIWEDPHPKPCYLFALVGGDLGVIQDRFVTSEKRDVALAIYVEKGKETQAHYAMDALKRSMRWDETAFGRAYDLDVFNIVAVSDFNMGAMENKGLNIFNDKYVLASAETATDTDYALIEAIIAHEYFHNWTGNRITCRDWFQLCLKEGLTVFRDQEFSSDQRSRAVKRIMDVRELRARQFVEDAGPLAHPVRPRAYREINNFYTATVYEKGAEVIRMLKLIIGPEPFKQGMDLYFTRHDGDAATIEQFIACFAEVSGRDLAHFSQWYDQAGTPHVTVKRDYDAKAKALTLHFSQHTRPTPGQVEKRPQVIPLALGFVQRGDSTAPERPTEVIILDQPELSIRREGIAASEVPSLLRGFSAPVNLELDLDDSALLTLARHDSDAFNRWQSLQTLAMHHLKRQVAALRRAEESQPHDGLADAIGDLLRQGEADPAFTALAVTLPSELDIARELGEDIDPDAIHRARTALRESIATRVLRIAQTTYRGLPSQASYTPDAAAAGRRALRNAALDVIVVGNPTEGPTIALHQFHHANNMTDRFGALSLLAHAGGPLREQALSSFEQQFKGNALVMDKWFALQAMIADDNALERMESLLRHPAFSLANPNRARSLIGGFSMANPTQFNRADGAGYAFVIRMILAIDAGNPQVAARIMTAFRSWRTMEAGRKVLAEKHLTLLAKTRTLSRDLNDIVERTLA